MTRAEGRTKGQRIIEFFRNSGQDQSLVSYLYYKTLGQRQASYQPVDQIQSLFLQTLLQRSTAMLMCLCIFFSFFQAQNLQQRLTASPLKFTIFASYSFSKKKLADFYSEIMIIYKVFKSNKQKHLTCSNSPGPFQAKCRTYSYL